LQYQTIKNIIIMNEQVFKPIENYVNDFKNHFINTFTSGELSKYMDKENIQIFNTNPFETDKDIITKQVYFIPFIKENINEAYNYINHENGFIYDYVIEMFEYILYKLYYTSKIELYIYIVYFNNIMGKINESFDLSNFIEDNLNTYYNNKMNISYFVNENMYNSIFNLDIMNNGIYLYLSHSLGG
jgi:hypothetical protein